MKSLFFRLFIAFLLAMMLSGAVFFALAFKVRDWMREKQRPEVTRQLYDYRPPPPGLPHQYPAPGGLRPPQHLLPPFVVDWGVQSVIFLVVGAGGCYLLAWRMSAPVRTLRSAVQRLTDGDLTARTGLQALVRGDELADLGADFDLMAERIEKLVVSQKQLVRDISHELRSPLARLQVALGLARKVAAPAAEPSLNRIEQEAERLNRMIGELLTLSLLENGTPLAESTPLNLNELLEEIVQDADFEAAARQVRVQLQAPQQLQVSGSHELLRQSIENVVRNALNYTAPGSEVTVGLERSETENVQIHVRDHGPGVPAEALQAIFQPFYRVAEARDRQSGGTGIGLAITARVVALHNGTVTARNRQEGGLEVTINLPLGGIS